MVLAGLRPKTVDGRALALTRGVGAATAFIMSLETYALDVLVVVNYVPMIVAHRELQMGVGMDELIDEMTNEFQNTAEYFNDRFPTSQVTPETPVFLTGGHPQLGAELAIAIGNILGRGMYRPDPPMEYPENFPLMQYTINVGLALKRL